MNLDIRPTVTPADLEALERTVRLLEDEAADLAAVLDAGEAPAARDDARREELEELAGDASSLRALLERAHAEAARAAADPLAAWRLTH